MGRGRARPLLLTAAVLLALRTSPAAGNPGGEPHPRPTGAALLDLRARVARLEAEQALSGTRKPYVVLDLAQRLLRYRLVGMTMRDVPLASVAVDGLEPVRARTDPGAPALAGIFTFTEKDGDPRLSPLTPEQIEAGLDDENAADALPPSPPAAYSLSFKQPIRVRIEGMASGPLVTSAWAKVRSWWSGLLARRSGPEEAPAVVRLGLRIDEETAREVYRSLVPDERWLVIPPAGLVLPEAGQEALPKPRSPRPVPQRPPQPSVPAPGIPFQIPPPQLNEQPPPGAAPIPPPEEEPAPAPQEPSAPQPPGAP